MDDTDVLEVSAEDDSAEPIVSDSQFRGRHWAEGRPCGQSCSLDKDANRTGASFLKKAALENIATFFESSKSKPVPKKQQSNIERFS